MDGAFSRTSPRTFKQPYQCLQEVLQTGYTEIPVAPGLVATHAKQVCEGLSAIIDGQDRDDFIFKGEYPLDELGRKMEFGLIERDRPGDDKKFFLHYSDQLEQWLCEHPHLRERHRETLMSLRWFNDASQKLVCGMMREWDIFHGTSFEAQFREGCAITRAVRYEVTQENHLRPTADIHTDYGGITEHWFSTHPGFKLFDTSKRVVSLQETNPGFAGFFPGQKITALTRGSYGFHGIHGAVDRRTSVEEKTHEKRVTIVSFVHPRLTDEDVEWFHENKPRFKIDPAEYSLSA